MIILTDKMLVIPVGISPNYSSENKPSLEDKSVEITANGDYSYTAGPEYYGIGNFNVKVNVQIPVESEKTVNPSFNEDVTVLPSEGFDAMSSVIVKKAEANLEDKNVEINENGNYSYTASPDYDGIGNLNVKVNVQEKEIRYAIRPTSGRLICPLTNVLLSETSWVSVDFAMDTSSLNKEKACLFGISASSLHCYLNNGVLHMYTGEEVPFNKQITLDTNKHTLEFGFVSKADESGHAEFEVVFDGEMVADVMVLVPTYNLPLSLFDIAVPFYDSYDSYIQEGGIIRTVNGTGYGVGDSVFDLFSLTVYDKPGYYRQTINAYTPSFGDGGKPIFIDNITGEYQYPASGTYSYVKIDGDTRTEIASATYTMPFSNDFQYFRPSAGAIVPTDIELPALHKITMYVKDIDSFDEGTSQDALNNVKNRVMIGAQPNIIAPFNHIDYEKGLPRLIINDENTAILGDTSVGLFNSGFEVYSGYTYSLNGEDAYRSVSQAFPSLKGEHTIKFGQRAADIYNIYTFFLLDDNEKDAYSIRGIITPDVITRVNERKMTPLCIFGTYNFVEGTKPDYVNSLGYQEALNQIGYTTGVRYAVKQIDIEEYPLGTTGENLAPDNDIRTLRHRLVTHTDINGVNCLFDTITGTPYYPYNGTLDVYTGPVEPEPEPEPPVPPTILTDTYVKPSEGAIVPTDIKFTSLTNVTMHVKGFDNFNNRPNKDSIAMIGAQPNFIVSPFKDTNRESAIGIYFNGCGNVLNFTNSKDLYLTNYSKHSITVGYDPMDINNINMDTDTKLVKKISIDEQGQKSFNVGGSDHIYQLVDNQMTTPICIFGNYNNPSSMTPDDVIALGYENALTQIGYVTGARYGVKQIDINVRNVDGSMTTTHSLVPAKDTNNKVLLYDTITEKSYYPFHGTLDII